MEDESKIWKELFGFGDHELAGFGINDRALQGLKDMIGDQLGIMNSDGTPADVVEGATDDQLKRPHGLSELCRINVKGHSEQVFKLTELFLPREDDFRIRQRMDKYNKVDLKMPHLKQTVPQELLDQRKRAIKAEMKRAADKLRHQATKGTAPSVMMSDLQYLHSEIVTEDQIDFKNRYANAKHIAKIEIKKKPVSILEQRRKPVVPQDEEMPAHDEEPTKKEEGPIYLKVDKKSSIMQQIELNLQEIEKIRESTCDTDKELKQEELQKQYEEILSRVDSIENLTAQERQVLKMGFSQNHHSVMKKMHPPLYSFGEVEKCCFEFAMDLNFENYSYNGQPSLQKSETSNQFQGLQSILGQTGNQNLSQNFNETEDMLKNSIFAEFLEPKKDEQEYMIMSQDSEMEQPSTNKIEKSYDQYRILRRDNKIRNAMVENKFENLRVQNQNLKNKLKRRKYWGELNDGDTQHQVDKDYMRYKFYENHLPVQPIPTFFTIEQISTKGPEIKTKYGSLALCGAHANNFKIDKIQEYEFVQKQRAYLYDPLYIKGSSQFKSFSSQVGFGSYMSRTNEMQSIKPQKQFDKNCAIQNLYQNCIEDSNENKLEKSAAVQQIYKCLGLEENNPVQLMSYDFKEAEKMLQLDPKKQKLVRQNDEILSKMTDDFDVLTNNVKLKKFKEYIQRKNDEQKRNAMNMKKNQSTAYRPTDLFVPRPESMTKTETQDLTGDGSKIENVQSQEAKVVEDQYEGSDAEYYSFENRESLGVEEIKVPKIKKRKGDASDESSDDSDIIDIENETFEGLNQNASHAKCILDLSYTKFKWNINEDFSRFHRPNIQSYFDFERERIKYSQGLDKYRNETATLKNPSHISIGEDGQIKLNQYTEPDLSVEIPVQIIDRDTIARKNKKRGIINADEYFKDRIKLSLKDGKFCLFEHVDQNPIFVNNFGMVSKLHRYLYNDRALPANQFSKSSQNNKIKHMGPFGHQVLKQPNQKLPLLGNIDKQHFQGISVLSNKLYRAPIFYHRPQRADFFCSFFQDKKGGRQIILREIQNIYSVGQIEPLQNVYNPQSRNYQTYIKEHSKAYIIRFLQENNNKVDFREIQHLFSYLTDQMLKKFIKEISVEVNRDQVCSSTKQLSDETIKNLITPEMICRYESALYGEAMLRMRGIENITNADKISYASNKYCSEQRDVLKQKISKFIENEILCTPWNLSSNFCTINQNNGMLMIRGVGDPSNNNGGFSFLKMPLKISNDCFKDCQKIRQQLNPAMQNPKSVTGTDADLRKLKKGDIFDMLIGMGYDRNKINDLSRWNMVGYLRQHSSNLQGNGNDDKNKRYARGIRYTAKTQREMYHKQVDQLFKVQMIYLTGLKNLHDESDLEDPSAQFNIPANNANEKNQDDSGDEVYSQSDPKKFIIEISDKNKIGEITEDKKEEELDLNYPYGRLKSGNIATIKDIPHYKRLLIANIMPNQNQQIQTGGQIGLINIGSNSGTQQDNIMNFRNAEQLLQKRLDEKEMTLKCRVLKKIIKSEDEGQQIERIEFNSDPKVIKKFLKRQSKCKIKKDRQKKTGLRQKMQQAQIAAITEKKEFQDPLPPKAEQSIRLNQAALKSFNASVKQSNKKSSIKEEDHNTIQFSMSDLLEEPVKKKEELPQIIKDDGNSNKITIGFDFNDLNEVQEVEESSEKPDEALFPLEEDDEYIPTAIVEEPKPKKQKKTSIQYKQDNLVNMQIQQQMQDQQRRQNLSSRRTKQSGSSMLNNIIEKIVDECANHDQYKIFYYKVDKAIAPGYDVVITRPIWLEQMRQKAKRQEYQNISQLQDDMALLRSNAETYNGVMHDISELARTIERVANQQVNSPEYREQIDEAMMKIQYM